ncbi:VOC family protein [Halarchaeum salinum]|uniref:VOC family protein n=1 Tax=Halarchaeum salinum TaxID=489912 RepID=A0AAV3S9V3_9EURY
MRPVIDSVPFAGPDLDALVERFENAGFAPQYGGEHVETGTETAMIVLPDGSALELLAPAGPDADDSHWPAFGDADAGPCAWGVDAGSVHSELQRAISHDVTVRGPIHERRETDRGVAEWDVGFLGGSDSPLPFVVSDRTPREYRVPDSTLYGSPLSGIGRVLLAVTDLDAAITRFTDLYRLPEPERDYDDVFGDLAAFPGQDVVLCEPDEGAVRERIERFGACPAAVLLSGDVSDAAAHHPLHGGRTLFGKRVRFVDGFDTRLGVVER